MDQTIKGEEVMVSENEIKVGNWFHHNNEWSYRNDKPDNSGTGFNFQWELRDWYALGECTLNLEQISPIPLTLGILYDCGFEVYHENPRLEMFYVNKQGYYPFFIYQSRDTRFWFNENLELKSVHQLQNLYYALTGEELTVNLEI